MPTDKPPVISFNQWISLNHAGPYAPVAAAWQVTRGRLTRASVVARSVKVGVDGATAGQAYDAYCEAVGLTSPASSSVATL